MSTIRITFIGPVPPLRSGIAQNGGYLAAALARDSDVAVESWQHQYPRLLFRRAQRDESQRPYPGARFSLRWWDPSSWWRAGRRASSSDLVVLIWTTPFHALAYRLIMQIARRTKIVGLAHNAVPHEPLPLQRPLTRWVLSRCDGLVAHASTVADELRAVAGDVETEVVSMPALVDVQPHPLPRVEDGLRLLFLGFVRPYKGLDVALDALVILRDRGLRPRLTVVGEFWGPIEPWPLAITERGLEDQVELRPEYVPNDEVGAVLASHHAVVLPYRSASQSGVAPIALAAGRPVIATNVGGLQEVIHEGLNGTLATPGDAASLADAIERCAADVGEMAARAGDDAPSWAEVADAVVKASGLSR